jgi:translation initiation factor 1
VSNIKLVWSDDPKDKERLAAEDGKTRPIGDDGALVKGSGWTAVFRIEKGGRGGKTVTVIDQLPKHETFLRELCKELKSKCGSGGTFDAATGRIEIQGDKREPIKAIFTRKGIRYKGM